MYQKKQKLFTKDLWIIKFVILVYMQIMFRRIGELKIREPRTVRDIIGNMAKHIYIIFLITLMTNKLQES